MSRDPRVAMLAGALGVPGARHAANCVRWAEDYSRRNNGWAAPAGIAAVRALLEEAAAWDDDRSAEEGPGSAEVPQASVLSASPSTDSLGSPVEWIGTKEAAAMLGCSDRNVRDLAARGTLTGHRLGRRLVVDALEVHDLVQARRTGGAA